MVFDNPLAFLLLLLVVLIVLIPLLAFGFVVCAIWMGIFLALAIGATLMRKLGVRRSGGSVGGRPEIIDLRKEGTLWKSR